MRQWSHYTIEEKLYAVAALRAGASARSIEAASGIDHHLLASWLKAYEAGGASALQPYAHTRRYPAHIKAAVVAEYQSGETTLRKLCAKYGISNPGLCYKWIQAAR